MDESPTRRTLLKIVAISRSHPLFRHAETIRRRVFVQEQGVDESGEWDGEDVIATHLLLFYNGEPAGTLRQYDDGGRLRIGRVAVLPEFRNLGFGKLLMEHGTAEARRRGFETAYLHSRSDRVEFYRRLGFTEYGDEFMEENIPHKGMEKRLS